jgi:fatty-acyl-CoA synthase
MADQPRSSSPYETGLDKNSANYIPLSPLSFIRRAAAVYPQHPALVYAGHTQSWSRTFARCVRLASALAARGVGAGDTVAVMAPNIPAIYEASFAVPMLGAVLNTLNIRLDAATIAYSLEHGEAKVLITDTEFYPVVAEAVSSLDNPPLIIDVHDTSGPGGERLGESEYENFLLEGDPGFRWRLPDDEWQAVSLNYTSGTTGKPKGVVYHHRGAYLNAISNILGWNMGSHPVYLWTLPMFHCNGWCFPWTLACAAGTSVCIRKVEAKAIFDAIGDQGVTHFCGAPIVLSIVLNAKPEERREFSHTVEVMTAAAPPPAAVLKGMEAAGFHMTHVYGLTETYGPAVICAWKKEWDQLPVDEGLSQKSGGNAAVLRRRLVSLRRSGRDAPGRLHPAQRSLQGHYHLWRREHFIHRSGRYPLPSSGSFGGRGGGSPGRKMGRNPVRIRDTQGRRQRRHRVRYCRLLPREHGAIQGAQDRGLRTAAENLHRQDSEVQAERAGEKAVTEGMRSHGHV